MKMPLTFGFELEGLFYSDVIGELERCIDDVVVKTDGSVRYQSIVSRYADSIKVNKVCWEDEDYPNTEIAVGVFNSADNLLNALSKLKNGENYFSDSSCGLHLHVGVVRNTELRARMKSYGFIKKLQEFAGKNLCTHVKNERLKGNTFCRTYDKIEGMASDFRCAEKYRFVRNHPQGTLEFRFLSACEHKQENVKKFIDEFMRLLAKRKTEVKTKIKLDTGDRTINQNIKLPKFRVQKMSLKMNGGLIETLQYGLVRVPRVGIRSRLGMIGASTTNRIDVIEAINRNYIEQRSSSFEDIGNNTLCLECMSTPCECRCGDCERLIDDCRCEYCGDCDRHIDNCECEL